MLSTLIRKFCFNTIRGHESGLYKSALYRDIMQTDMAVIILAHITIEYLNGCYKSLILRNDKYVIDVFDDMQKIDNHSVICLLHIILETIKMVHFRFDRNKLDMTNYDCYMISVDKELTDKIKIVDKLEEILSHKCNGIDIKTCDPTKPLFSCDFTTS